MPNQTTLIDIPLVGGLDENARAEKVDPGAFVELNNVRMTKRGSYHKRHGFAALGIALDTGGNVGQTKRLATIRDELCQVDDSKVYTLGKSGGLWHETRGYAPRCVVSRSVVAPIGFPVQSYDAIKVGDYIVSAWSLEYATSAVSAWSVYATITDVTNGATVSGPVNVLPVGVEGGAQAPYIRLVVVGSIVILLYGLDGSQPTSIYGCRLDATSQTTIAEGWSGATEIFTDLYAGEVVRFDACSCGGSSFAVVYVNDSDSAVTDQTVTVALVSSTMSVQNSTTIAGGTVGGEYPITVSIDGLLSDVVWVAFPFDLGPQVRVLGFNSSLSVIEGAASVIDASGWTSNFCNSVCVTRTGTRTGMLMAANDGTETLYIQNFAGSSGTVAATGDLYGAYGLTPDCRPFRAVNKWFCTVRSNLYTDRPDNGCVWLVDITSTLADATSGFAPDYAVGFMRYAGTVAPRLCQSVSRASSLGITQPVTISASEFAVPVATVRTTGTTTTQTGVGALELASFDFGDARLSKNVQAGSVIALAGSPVSQYDGGTCAEIGFAQRPRIIGTPALSAGTLTGSYSWVAVFESIDGNGNWHQSSPSDPTASLTLAAQQASVTMSQLQISNRSPSLDGTRVVPTPDVVRVALYRTKDSGTVFWRVPEHRQGSPVTGSDFIIDNTADNDLGAPLYTQPEISGTALPKAFPPSFNDITVANGRIFGITGKDVWFSGQPVFGEAAWFADAFQFPVEAGTGDLTAISSMDGAIVLFKRDAILFVDGQGPPDNGVGGDFTPPQQMASCIGCINPDSIAVTPDGIIFQSLRGLELLTRGRQVPSDFFGSPVEDTVAANPFISSAVVDQENSLVKFTCLPDSDSRTGVSVCWDYQKKLWTTETLGDGLTSGVGVRSAVMVSASGGQSFAYTWLKNGYPSAFQESTTTYRDAGRWVTSSMVTPWIHPGGIVGFVDIVRALLIAQSATGHDLTLSVGYDYATSYTDVRTWTAAEIAALTTSRQILEVDFTQKECTAFRLKVSDATPSSGAVGTGQGPIFMGLQVEGANEGIAIPLAEENRK